MILEKIKAGILGEWISKREYKSLIGKRYARQCLVRELTPYF